MAKKSKTLEKAEDKQLASAVRTSAQQIWQAGLGAFAKAQEEGGRVFSKLVKEGTDLQKRTQKLAENKAAGVTDTVTKMADDAGKQAPGSWDKLEQVFEDRVARALSSIGVPTRSDVEALTRRIEQLSNAIAQLSGKFASESPKVDAAFKASVNGAAKLATTKPATSKPALKVASKIASNVASKAGKPASVAASNAVPKIVAKSVLEPESEATIEKAVKVVKTVKAASAMPKTLSKPVTKQAAKAALKPITNANAGSGFPSTESVSKAARDKQAAAKLQVK